MVPSFEEELGALRERAYGPHADIAADPDALRRLRELEIAGRPSTPAPPRGDSDRQPQPAPSDTSSPRDPIPVEASPDAAQPDVAEPRTPGRRLVVAWAASVAVAALLAVLATLVLTPGPTAEVAPGVSARQVAEVVLEPGVEWPSGFEAGWAVDTGAVYLGVTMVRMQERGTAASECLMVWVPLTGQVAPDDGTVEGGCRTGAFPARAEVLVDLDAPAELRQRFAVGTALQFLLVDGRVTVYSDRG
ncbi:hypothetical protein AB3M83_02770 [Microbacterium sp. 179-B 1A2 NHS]|uniref:hypothetical protein n=1 Tax=Microbacterium sp. 179-B 1A2 NHS TaxID=3142383 RepID=UPI0039A36655